MSKSVKRESRTGPAKFDYRVLLHTFASVASQGEWIAYDYLWKIAELLTHAAVEGNARIIIELPPRHGKSELVSHWMPTWYLGWFPEKNVMLTSYEATFAAKWGRTVRDELLKGHFPLMNLARDSKARAQWHTNQGGGMVTAGIGGAITGRGFDLGLIDDPVKNWEEASSEVFRQKAIDWFNSVFYTRAEPNASIILLMTRWHERDLAGYLEHEHPDKWTVIRLPAIAEEGDWLGREEGEALCADRYSSEELARIKHAIGSRMFACLYQQRPSPEEGNIIHRDWWKFWTALPKVEQMIQSWDCAFKGSQKSDYVVGQCWGQKGPDRYLIDQVRGKLSFTQTIQAILTFSQKHPKASLKLIEDKANGPAIIDSLRKQISGIVPYDPKASKEARLHAVAPQIESGHVWIPRRAEFTHDYIEEFSAFPNGKHDDQVDATTQALKRMDTSGESAYSISWV